MKEKKGVRMGGGRTQNSWVGGWDNVFRRVRGLKARQQVLKDTTNPGYGLLFRQVDGEEK